MTHTVRAHERAAPRKPEAYINTHMALFSRRTDAIRFAQRHGVEIEAEAPKQESVIERFLPWFRRRT